MASVSWAYAEDQLIALRRQNAAADAAAPVATGVDINALNFRYRIEGDNPPWRPLRAFDDGRQVFIEFPSGIARARCRRSGSSAPKATASSSTTASRATT